jgi:hypothetical protein
MHIQPPPWLCQKKKYIHLSMVIQGPKQPGNDLSLYIQLLKDELETLWDPAGVNTWDAATETYFPMRAALLTTIQDYLAYGYIACQVCHGHKACVRCMDETTYKQLQKDPGSSKTVFPGHRRWLPMNDPWRKRGELFNGEDELRGPPRKRSGEVIRDLLNAWEECPAPGKKQKAVQPLMGVWKGKCPLSDLPYWWVLKSPHCLDVMHITKNFCESLTGTLFNMAERTRDGPKARNDLIHMNIREDLHGGRSQVSDDDRESDEETQGGGRRKGKRVKRNEDAEEGGGPSKRVKKNDYYCPPSCFTLDQKELKQLFECLLGVRVPRGYSGLIRRWLDPKKQCFSGMKSHDCHVMMTQILPVAIRGIMDKHVRDTLIDVCNFFDVISRKSITLKKITRMQEEIVVILCELEMYFPPAFFDIMVHLLVHVVDDIIALGPTFLHNMMPFERLNGIIKEYVRTRSKPDGSIVQGWLTEECVSFCTNYLESENPVGLPVNKHLGRLDGVGHKNGRRELHVGFSGRRADFDRANLVALQHIQVLDYFVNRHKESIAKKYTDLGKTATEKQIFNEHNSTFVSWFKQVIEDNPPPLDNPQGILILTLAHGPMPNLFTYQSYDINGYTFCTEEKDKNSDWQNSGVTMEAYTGNEKTRYYGRIEEIWELSYSGEKIPMFRVRWAKNVIKEERGNFTTMVIPEPKSIAASANVAAQNEPWVLASKVTQCWFMTDPSKPSRVVVRRGKRNIAGMDGVAHEEDFGQYGDPLEDDDDDDATPYTTRRSRTTLPPKSSGLPFTRRSKNVPGLNYATATKKGKKIVKR